MWKSPEYGVELRLELCPARGVVLKLGCEVCLGSWSEDLGAGSDELMAQ